MEGVKTVKDEKPKKLDLAGNDKIKLIHIQDPMLCLFCDLALLVEVRFSDNSTRKMIYCERLDCDNWILDDKEEGTDEQTKPVDEV